MENPYRNNCLTVKLTAKDIAIAVDVFNNSSGTGTYSTDEENETCRKLEAILDQCKFDLIIVDEGEKTNA